jgi:hypothetical protein
VSLLSDKLAAWARAVPGRHVEQPQRVNVNAVAFACDCSQDGELVVRVRDPRPTPR